jgi:hypothetical protein
MSQVGIVIVAGNREHREAVSDPALVALVRLGLFYGVVPERLGRFWEAPLMEGVVKLFASVFC